MLGNIGIVQLLIVLLIVLLIFGTKRFRQAGGDIGTMIRELKAGFKNSEDDDPSLVDIAGEVGDARRQLEEAKRKLRG